MKRFILAALAIFPGLATATFAGPLREAKISQIVNDVKLVEPREGARAAALQDVIKDDRGVATGVQSRAELLFQDNTLTRLGAETYFSFQPGTRDLKLERGSMLLQVPKNLGGARIRAASVTASITGTTVLVENLPGTRLKLTVLEGSMEVATRANPADKIDLRAGKMMIVNPGAKSLPTPVNVNLRALMRDSVLANPVLFRGKSNLKVAELPSAGLIEKEIAFQDAGAKDTGMVAATTTTSETGTARTTGQTLALLDSDKIATNPARTDTPLATTIETNVPLTTSTTSSTTLSPDPVIATTLFTPAGTTKLKPRTLPNPGTTGFPVGIGSGTGTGAGIPLAPVDPLTTAGFLRPDWKATATTPAFAPANPPPVTVALANPMIFGGPGNAAIFGLTGALPQRTLGGSNFTGAIYGGAAVDGSAAMFAFGSMTNFEAQVKFDSRFGIGSESAFPAAGVAIFRLVNNVTLGGNPVFTTSTGTRDLALFVGSNISTAAAGASLDLSALHSLTLATGNGGISLGNNVPLSATAGSGFKFLHLYASGLNGNVTLNNAVNLPGAGLLIDAQTNIVVSPTACVNVDHAAFNAGQNISIQRPLTADTVQISAQGALTLSNLTSARRVSITAGSFSLSAGSLNATDLSITTTGDIGPGTTSVITAGTLSLKAGGTLTLNTVNPVTTRLDLSGTTQFHAEANTIALASDVILPAGSAGTLKAGTGISAKSFSLGGFDSVESGGNVKLLDLDTRNFKATGNVTIYGNTRVTTADVSGWFYTTGTISPHVGAAATTLSVLKADTLQAFGGMAFKGASGSLAAAPSAGYRAVLDVTSAQFSDNRNNGINGANFDGGDALPATAHEGGDGGMLSVGTDLKPVAGKIEVSRPITATTGANGSGVATGGVGGTVRLIASDTITVGSTVKVSESAAGKASKQGGNIRIDSRKTSGTAISVTSSGQLLALLSAAAPGAGGRIEFTSAGGDILVNGGKVQADKGTVDIRNTGATGKVQLTNATLSGDVVKVGALGANGELRIGGGTINADTSLKLYGGSSNGSVRFTDNVTLGGDSTKIIAGKTVTIDSRKTVTIAGPSAAQVFTDGANYTGSGGNGSTTGQFGGKGATTTGFVNRPGF